MHEECECAQQNPADAYACVKGLTHFGATWRVLDGTGREATTSSALDASSPFNSTTAAFSRFTSSSSCVTPPTHTYTPIASATQPHTNHTCMYALTCSSPLIPAASAGVDDEAWHRLPSTIHAIDLRPRSPHGHEVRPAKLATSIRRAGGGERG